ncbi:MAG: YCF48-related protein, partial [Blastocatellia bacterium]
EDEARAIIADLKVKGIEAYWVKAEVPGKGTRYRVRIGKFWSQVEARKVADRAISQNLFKEFIVTPYETPTSSVAIARPEPKANPAETVIAKVEKPKAATEKAAAPSSPVPDPVKEIAAATPVAGTNPEKSVRASVETAPETKPEPKLEAPKPVEKVEPKATTAAGEKPAPTPSAATRPAAKPEVKIEEAPKAALPSAGGDPAIATPAVPEALGDVAFANDNWKVVRRSAETDKNLRSIYFVDAMTGWAAGDSGAVYRTTDSGRTWKPLLSGAPANIDHIHFVDWNHGWMLGENSNRDDESEAVLFMTTNGGKTWSRKPLPSVLSVHFTDAKNGWAVGRNATLMKTTDGGNEWVKVDSMEKLIGLPVESSSYNYGFRDIQFVDARNGWLIGNFYGRARSNIGGIFMTTDGGVTWKRVPVTIQTQYTSGRFTPGVFHSVKFTDLDNGSVTGEMYDGEGRFFFVLHTKDGGKTWEQYRTPSRATHSTQFLDLANGWSAASAPREGSAEAVVYDTTLMRTDNGGMSWRNDFIAKGRRIRGVFFLSPTKGWAVGDRGMILRYEEKLKAN